MPVERCAQRGESVGPSGPGCSQQTSKLCRVASQGCQRPAATPNSSLQARSLAGLLPAPALIPPCLDGWAVSLERFRTCWEAGRDLGKQGTAWVGVVQRVQASVFTFCQVGAAPHSYLGTRMTPGWLGNPRQDIYSTCKESLHGQTYPGVMRVSLMWSQSRGKG